MTSEGCELKGSEVLGGSFPELFWMGSNSRQNLGDHAVCSLCFRECAALTLQWQPRCIVRTFNPSEAAVNAFNGTTYLKAFRPEQK